MKGLSKDKHFSTELVVSVFSYSYYHAAQSAFLIYFELLGSSEAYIKECIFRVKTPESPFFNQEF